MSTNLIKALLMNAAATQALAVCGDAQGEDGVMAVDPMIQDLELRDKGVMVYEEAKIQYHALLRAFEDKTGIWPDPKISSETEASPSGQDFLAALRKLPESTPLGATVGALLSLFGPTIQKALPGQELLPPKL